MVQFSQQRSLKFGQLVPKAVYTITKYSQSCEHLGSCLLAESLIIKSSRLFDCGILPHHINLCLPDVFPHGKFPFSIIEYKTKNKIRKTSLLADRLENGPYLANEVWTNDSFTVPD